MVCEGCGRVFSYKRSTYCIGCAAAHTLLSELKEDWASESLRRLGEDICVSAARHLRALRLYSGADFQRATTVNEPQPSEAKLDQGKEAIKTGREVKRSPLARIRRPREQQRKSQPVHTRGHRETEEKTATGAASSRGEEVDHPKRYRKPDELSAEAAQDYSYSTYYSSEDEKGDKTRSRKPLERSRGPLPGITPKARPEKEPAGVRGKEEARQAEPPPQVPLKLESKQEVFEKKVKAELAESPKVDVGSTEDKANSKKQYLDSLKDLHEKRVRQAEKPGEPLRRSSEGAQLDGSLLSLAGDYRDKEDGSKKRRRKQ